MTYNMWLRHSLAEGWHLLEIFKDCGRTTPAKDRALRRANDYLDLFLQARRIPWEREEMEFAMKRGGAAREAMKQFNRLFPAPTLDEMAYIHLRVLPQGERPR